MLCDCGRGSGQPNPRTVTGPLQIVELTSVYSLSSGTRLLERGWALFYPGVVVGERRGAVSACL